jgi:hypothetical protein
MMPCLVPSVNTPYLKNPPTIVPTICSGLTDDDRTTAIRAIVVSISPGSIIEEGSSTPQSQAFNWVVNVDQNCPGSDEDNTSIEQRYILAVLYYSTNGADWTDSGAFLSVNLTECLWRIPDPASGDGIFCTDNGTVVNRIAIGKQYGSLNLVVCTLHPNVTALLSLTPACSHHMDAVS